jgi:uncharacterized protein YuzE
MKAVLVGMQNYNNLKMQDGAVIDGVKLFFNYKNPDVKGVAADNKFVNGEHLAAFGITVNELEMNVGSEVDIDYGPKNKIVGISIIKLPEHVQGTIGDSKNKK